MKNEVKLIALDLDSTLLYNREFANNNDLSELQRLQNEGYYITLSTGQSYDTASKYAKKIGIDKYLNKMVCQNGAYITSVDKFVPEQVHTIDETISRELIAYFEKHHYEVLFLKYNEFDTYYYLNFDPEVIKEIIGANYQVKPISHDMDLSEFSFIWLRLFYPEDEKFLAKIEKLWPNRLALSSSYTDDMSSMDVMLSDFNANKGERLLSLANQLNITPNEILAIGDGGNDVSMFERVKYSVAMGNAKQHVKDSALYVTDTCLDSGVSNFLKKHF